MSLHQFFLEEQILEQENDTSFALRLTPEDFKHAKILRLQVGEHIAVIDAAGVFYECEILSITSSDIQVAIALRKNIPSDRPNIVLAFGLPKADKAEMIIRHATELGVSGFLPFSSKRSVVKLDPKKAAGKQNRWQAIAKSAAMQSGQLKVPEVFFAQSFEHLLEIAQTVDGVIICWEEGGKDSLKDAVSATLSNTKKNKHTSKFMVVIGPEGGLSEDEVTSLLVTNPNATTISLGPSILRAETASIVAPALLLYELGYLS